MKNLIALLAFAITLTATAQPQFNTVAEMRATLTKPETIRRASSIRTLGYLTPFDTETPLDWSWDSTNVLATNEIRLGVGTNATGRLIHRWDGDARVFGVVGDNSTDNYVALTNAIAVAKTLQKVLKLSGRVKTSGTLVFSDRVNIEGVIGDSSSTPGAAIIMTATNLPIIEVRGGRKVGLRNLSLRYENPQDASQTNSTVLYFPSGYESYQFQIDNVSLYNGAYGISGSGHVYNGSFRDIWINDCSRSFIAMEGGGTTVTWDNIYCQNVGVGSLATLWHDSSQITSVVRSSGTNLTFTTSDELPTLLQTNAFVSITGLAPSAYNGYVVVTGFDRTSKTFYASLTSDPGTDPSDSTGVVWFTPKPMAETPVKFHYGMNTVSGLDIEHVFIGPEGFAAVAFRGELSSVKDLHLEQIYFTNGVFVGQPVHYIRHSGKATEVTTANIINSGIPPGRTNAVVGTLTFVSAASAPQFGTIAMRDIGMSGASLVKFVEYSPSNPDPVFRGWSVGQSVRANAHPVIDTSGPTPITYLSSIVDSGTYAKASTTVITNNQIIPEGMLAFGIDVKNVGSKGGNTVLAAFASDGTNRFYVDGNGKFFVQGQGQQVSEVGKSGLTTSAITITHDAATDRRLLITGNGLQVVSNSVPTSPMGLSLQTTYGGNLVIGNGTAGQGIYLGGTGPVWMRGTGSPEAVHTAPIGSLYSRTDGGAGSSLYVKESGTGNTGWVAK